MIRPKATTAIILDTRVTNKNGTHPVKLRVTHNRKPVYFALGLSVTTEDFEKINAPKPRAEHKETKIYLNSVEQKAIDIINELTEFTFERFKRLFGAKKADRHNIFDLFQQAIDKLQKEERAGTASSYKNSMSSLKSFTGKTILRFEDITVDFLKSYEKWHIKEGNSPTTVGIYLRNLRTLYNDAIAMGEAKRELYPFHKRGYQIPSGRGRKLALPIEELGKIFNYKAQTDSEQFAKDLWIFSYLCNGANIKDIARLKYKNIDKNNITFIRAKTALTSKKDQKNISAVLTDEAKTIINRWGNKPDLPDSYVFPILQKGISAERERAIIQQQVKNINKYINRVAEATGINKHITTYTARHSFSTVLKRSGAPVEFISESLGHSDTKTTQSYLDSFEEDVKKDWASKLTDFGKKD